MSDPKNVIDAMVAMRTAVEQRLLTNQDYIMLRSLETAIRAHNIGLPTTWAGAPQSGLRHQSQTDAAYAVVIEAAQPMTTNELLSAISQRGVSVGGANPSTNFSSALSRDARFKSVHWNSARRWWVTNLAMPPDPKPELSKVPELA